MKVNKLGMLIKFAAFYLCISFIVVSAIPLNDSQNIDKQAASVEVTGNEDYDAIPSSDKPTEASSSDTKPPLVFPAGDKSTSKNDTALEILQKNSNTSIINDENSSGKESTNATNTHDDKDYDEVNEMKKSEDITTENVQKSNDQKPTNSQEKESPKTENKDVKNEEDTKDKDYDPEETSGDDKEDTEILQENQDQGDLEEKYGVNSTSINVFEEPTIKGGHIAFIFASCLVFLSATAYVGLILWRKSLEHRYGMRQRLVTEDDYYNNNDVRFFGL